MKPQDLILRCYGYETPDGKWVAKCIDLSLVVEEDSIEKLKRSLLNAIISYIETVYDTKDKESIPKLLRRKSPLKDIAEYHFIAFLCQIHEMKNWLVFEQAIPMQPALAC